MKLVDSVAVAAGTDPERSAELGVHMRLIAIAKLGGEGCERRFHGSQCQAEAGQPPQSLEGAKRNARLRAERVSDVDRVTLCRRGQFTQCPAPVGFVRDCLDDAIDPLAAASNPSFLGMHYPHDLGSEGGHRKLFTRVRREFEGELLRRNSGRWRAHALEWRPGLARTKVKIDADRAARAEAVVMGFAGMMSEDAAAPPLTPAFALLLREPAREDDAQIIIRVPVGRDCVIRTVRGERQQLATRGARRDHVIGDSEPKRVGFVRHAAAGYLL